MIRIKNLADKMKDEICSAKDYTETALEHKAKNNIPLYNKYKEMANDELKHSTYLHDIIVTEIEELRQVYTPPQDMLEKWDSDHKKYIEKVAWIKQMLTM